MVPYNHHISQKMPMNYFILLKFILIFCLFMPLIRAGPNTWPWFHDKVFVAFVANGWKQEAASKAQISASEPLPVHASVDDQYNLQLLEALFGVMYLMKQNWHCDQISEKLKNNAQARIDCEKFGKYADIIYEYFFQVYVKGNKTANIIKPKFNNKHENKIDICEALIVLSSISKLLFNERKENYYDLKYDMEEKFNLTIIKELENEEELIDAIKNGQKEEASDKDLKNVRAKFNEKLEEFAKKAKEISDDEEMEEKELIVRRIWQGHPFFHEVLRDFIIELFLLGFWAC